MDPRADRGLVDLGIEMGKAEFGDRRLTRRLRIIASALSLKPDLGFPMAMGSESAVEGFYRFLRNGKVTREAILKPHIDATIARCAPLPGVLVVHDTTQFQYGSAREGLGTTNNRQPGFFGHFALALDPRTANRPLGLLAMTVFSRTKKKYSRANRAAYLRNLRHDPTKESLRWGDQVEAVERDLQRAHGKAIHVMDRESDDYVLIARMCAVGARFVIRATAKRRLFAAEPGDAPPEDREAWQDFPDFVEREVPLSARRRTSPYYCAGRHPVRQARVAKLRFAAKTVRVKRSDGVPTKWPPWLELNAVRVYEIDPPRGEEPVEWLLFTTEPIDSPAHICDVVDTYRARWTIEEYFKGNRSRPTSRSVG